MSETTSTAPPGPWKAAAAAAGPALLVGAYCADPVMAQPAAHGFTDRLPKPFRARELAELLARHLVAR